MCQKCDCGETLEGDFTDEEIEENEELQWCCRCPICGDESICGDCV